MGYLRRENILSDGSSEGDCLVEFEFPGGVE